MAWIMPSMNMTNLCSKSFDIPPFVQTMELRWVNNEWKIKSHCGNIHVWLELERQSQMKAALLIKYRIFNEDESDLLAIVSKCLKCNRNNITKKKQIYLINQTKTSFNLLFLVNFEYVKHFRLCFDFRLQWTYLQIKWSCFGATAMKGNGKSYVIK